MTDGPSIPPPPPSAGSSNLISRAINILTKPASEWRAIDGEATSVGKLIGGYAVILAIIAPIAMLLGLLISPFGSYIFHNIGALIKILLVIYVISFATPVLLGFIIDALTTNMLGVGYGGYLIWVGLPILLRVAADKAPVFTAAAVGIWAVLFIILQQIAWRVMYSGFYGGAYM